MIKFDFSLATSEERNNYISTFDLSRLKPSEVEQCANYILYGKETDGKSIVDKKIIYIKPKHSTFAPYHPESLDALMENPAFDESILIRQQPHFKKVKPKIDRKKDKDIPTMEALWADIDSMQHLLDVNTGKAIDEKEKKLTDTQTYKLRHWLVDVRRQQFYLKDIFKPTIGWLHNKLKFIPPKDEEDGLIDWNDPLSDYAFAPMGLIGEKGLAQKAFYDICNIDYAPDLYNFKAKHIIDFRNPVHVRKILERYEELCTSAIDRPDNLMLAVAQTLDYYIERANLKEQHYIIIAMKKKHQTNKQITQKLEEELGLRHTENYISTIYTHKICPEIANAAKVHYDQFLRRDDESAWKRCNSCNKVYLRDNRFFVKKNTSCDGLSGRCKFCDKIARKKLKLMKEKKEIENG